MNEAADAANTLPAIILFSFWWAFLSALELFWKQNALENAARPDTRRPAAETSGDDDPAFREIRSIDPGFNAKAFLQGARYAYEEILLAYARCDLKPVQALLSQEVFQAFADACGERMARGEELELTLVGIEAAEIKSLEVGPDAIEIAVLFRAEVVQVDRSAGGEIIRGDPETIALVNDLWTFSRARPLYGAAWTVIATDEAPPPAWPNGHGSQGDGANAHRAS